MDSPLDHELVDEDPAWSCHGAPFSLQAVICSAGSCSERCFACVSNFQQTSRSRLWDRVGPCPLVGWLAAGCRRDIPVW